MYCIHCGKEISDDSSFCVFCGKKCYANVQESSHADQMSADDTFTISELNGAIRLKCNIWIIRAFIFATIGCYFLPFVTYHWNAARINLNTYNGFEFAVYGFQILDGNGTLPDLLTYGGDEWLMMIFVFLWVFILIGILVAFIILIVSFFITSQPSKINYIFMQYIYRDYGFYIAACIIYFYFFNYLLNTGYIPAFGLWLALILNSICYVFTWPDVKFCWRLWKARRKQKNAQANIKP